MICFEAWAELAQQWLVCAPLRIHLDQLTTVNAVSEKYNHNYLHHLAQRMNCAVPNKKLFGPMVHHMSLSITLIHMY